MKKALSGIVITTLSLGSIASIVQADSQYKTALNTAQNFINISANDKDWKDKNPQILEEGIPFYNDKETPSYYEFNVTCNNNEDCGFVMVNVDGDDVSIPIYSYIGNSASNTLGEKNNKFFYFSPIEQYSENILTGEIKSINPQDYIKAKKEIDKESNIEKKSTRSFDEKLSVNSLLKSKLEKAKASTKEFKKTDKFKEIRNQIKEYELTNNINKYNIDIVDVKSTTPGSQIEGNTVLVKGDTTSSCKSQIPCYKQYNELYNNVKCKTGCSPTAAAMIYGYYDRNDIFPDLVPGVAKDYIIDFNTSTDIANMINDIRLKMKTTCDEEDGAGSTSRKNIKNGIEYAKDQGYKNSTSSYASINSSDPDRYKKYMIAAKNEIDHGRPFIASLNLGPDEGHSVVGYGYRNSSTIQAIRVNFGWGKDDAFTIGTKKYPSCAINININAASSGNYGVEAMTQYKIKK